MESLVTRIRSHAEEAWPAEERGLAGRVVLRTIAAEEVAGPDLPVAILTRASPRWLEAWGRCEERDADSVAAVAEEILADLEGRVAYALADRGRAVGIAVASDGLCGLLAVAVRRDRRGERLGASVVRALAEWARGRGARTLYAEVAEGDAAAAALFDRLGFAVAAAGGDYLV